jgi:hypothetical protein
MKVLMQWGSRFAAKPGRGLILVRNGYCVLLTIYALLLPRQSLAQGDIPLGSWRMHLSYNTISSIAISADKVFAASRSGIMTIETTDQSLNIFSKLNGLTGAGISFINFNIPTDQLIVAYDDGNLDIVKGNTVINFDRLKNSTSVTGSKRINHISLRNDFAYLASDYGLVVFDLKKNEVKETWRDLGASGGKLKVFQSAFFGDSIFMATEQGVLAGNLNDNLLDYNSWKRFDQGDFGGNIQFITSFNNKVFAAVNNAGIYQYENGEWNKEIFLQGLAFTSVNASANHLLITENKNLWALSTSNQFAAVDDAIIQQPLFAIEDSAGKFWVGDAKHGLVSNFTGSFLSYLPNGPSNTSSAKLEYYNEIIYSLPGGYSSAFQALNNSGGFDLFENGLWSNQTSTVKDLIDIDFNADKIIVSSFGYGLEEISATGHSVAIHDEDNSPLVNTNPPGRFVNITSVENSSDGLWVANYGTINSLHLLKSDNTWESFSFPDFAARYPTDLLIDFDGNIWMTLNPQHGGGLIVFDKKNNHSVYVTDMAGAGGLPSKSVRSIALDRDGYVWVGTDEGVAYFIDPREIFTESFDAIKPIFDNRFLLRSEKITTIQVDGANRKWIGTENGAWLFNPTGENLIYNFTMDNSPLIDNVIHDIAIHELSGEVFFATEKGIVSYRGDATVGSGVFQEVKIFPNPVTPEFNGTVGISGLTTDAIVKITDIAGKLVWQTQANGGTASWNVRDYNGKRAATGIYLVFATTQNASDHIVGKIAVVE